MLIIDGKPAYLYVPSGVAIAGSDGTNGYRLRRKSPSKDIHSPEPGFRRCAVTGNHGMHAIYLKRLSTQAPDDTSRSGAEDFR